MRELRDGLISQDPNQWSVFPVASLCIQAGFFFFFLVTSVLLAVYPGDNLLFPAQNQARE